MNIVPGGDCNVAELTNMRESERNSHHKFVSPSQVPSRRWKDNRLGGKPPRCLILHSKKHHSS
jgi:hypothetical protein